MSVRTSSIEQEVRRFVEYKAQFDEHYNPCHDNSLVARVFFAVELRGRTMYNTHETARIMDRIQGMIDKLYCQCDSAG